MISHEDFCLFITDEGFLYSMGSNEFGMLGLGNLIKNTGNISKKVGDIISIIMYLDNLPE
jgi:hypothetical protein